MEARQRGRGGDLAREPDRIGGDAAVLLLAEVIGLYPRLRARIGARGVHEASARGPQIADAERDRGEVVQRIAELVERERLDMELYIGRRIIWRGFGEHAELRRRHGQGPAPVDGVIEPHQRALEQRLEFDIERARALDAEDRAQLQMVLQIFAEAGERMHDFAADPLQRVGAPETGKLHQMRRADRAGGHDHLAPRPRALDRPSR